jgi:hypothetical protein
VESVAGEGAYPQTEAKIQALLRAGNPQLHLPPVMALLPQDSYDKPGAVCYPQTPELLVGRHHIADASSFDDPSQDSNYADNVAHPQDGAIYLQGFWHLTPEAAVSGGGDGFITLGYHAIQVVAVIKPEPGKSVTVGVTQDGRPIARDDAGRDLQYDAAGNSYVVVNAPRAYDLIMNARFGDHDLKLSPKAYGVGFYDFAFESCEIPGSSR